MKKIIYYTFLWLGFHLLLGSCQQKINNQQALYRWINDADNGLVKQKSLGDITLTMKYLPPELLVGKELHSLKQASKYMDSQKADPEKLNLNKAVDSLMQNYKNSRTFILNLTLNGQGKKSFAQDILYKGADSYAAYKSRAMEMNFNMANYLVLKADGKEMRPVIANMENTYSLTKGRNIYLVFADEKEQSTCLNAQKLDITFTDKLFDTGIHHFVFQKENLDNLPQVAYLNP